MDNRMRNTGRHIARPNYYSYFPIQQGPYSPAYSNEKANLRREISELKHDLADSEYRTMKKRFMFKVNSLVNLASRPSPEVPPIPSPPPPMNDTILELMTAMTKQQNSLTKNIKYLQQQALKRSSIPTVIDTFSPMNERPTPVSRVTAKDVYKEYNLSDDSVDEYLDDEKKYKFDLNLSDIQKTQLNSKIRRETETKMLEKRRKGLRGVSKFRALVFTVLFPIFASNSVRSRKVNKKNEYAQDMEDSIKVHSEMASDWVFKSIRVALLSLYNDPGLDFELHRNTKKFHNENNTKLLKLKLRIQGIIDSLIENTTNASAGTQFRRFLSRYTKPGSYVPRRCLTKYETARLSFDEFGALRSQTIEKRQMMIVFLIITKTVVSRFCLNPELGKLKSSQQQRVKNNLKVIGSLIQHMVLKCFLNTGRNPREGTLDSYSLHTRTTGSVIYPVSPI